MLLPDSSERDFEISGFAISMEISVIPSARAAVCACW